MKFRIFLKSFNKNLINCAIQELEANLLFIKSNITGIVALPTKIKKFCVLRSPHVDKNSREHFELRLYKRFIDITIESSQVLNTILYLKFPEGVACFIKLL